MTTNDQPSVPGPAGPPHGGFGPPPYQPPSMPKRPNWFARHKFLTGVFGVFALIVVIAIGTSLGSGGGDSADKPAAGASAEASPGTDGGAAEEAPATEQPAEEPAAGIGTPVADGSFEFTVTSVEPGVSSVGESILQKTAQGQYVIVHLTVSNIGKSAQYFTDASQLLIDTQGREHKADSTAGLYAQSGQEAWLAEINPGNTLNGLLVFDIPADATPAALELHDSMFSGGVTVQLG